nr:unnamed protein product [Spirometra erinaceieuropaei]
MARVEEVFNALSTSSRKDRKIRLSQAINVLKHPAVRRYLDFRSEQKGLNADAAFFTWRSVYEVTAYILREEIARVKCRGSKDFAPSDLSSASELADCCRLLSLFASFGLRNSLPFQAEGLVSQITDLLSDASVFSIKPSLVSCLSIAITNTPGLDVFDATTCLRLINWCIQDLCAAPSGVVAMLFCQVVNACTFMPNVLQRHLIPLADRFFSRCCGNLFDQQALGWLLRLLRWSLVTVFTSQSSQNAFIDIFLNHHSGLLKLWSKFREVTPQRSAYVSSADPSLFLSDDFVICVNEFLGDAFSIDELFASSPIAKRLFSQKLTSTPKLDVHALMNIFMSDTPLLYEASFRQGGTGTLASPCFLHSDACFLMDEIPTLLPVASTLIKGRLHVNAIETGRELLCLCRWILSICLLRFSCSGVPTSEDDVTMARICTFVSTIVQFYALEYRRFAERVSFLAEESVQAQVLSMWDFFGTCAAALCVARSPPVIEFTETRDLLEPLKSGPDPTTATPVTTNRSQVDHESLIFTTGSSPYVVAANMISRDEKTGWLWWPVFDWICRLNWQCACACGSPSSVDSPAMLHSAAVVVKSVRHPLAVDCAISALVSAVSAATACVKRFGLSTFSGNSASDVEAIWNKAVEWLEQLARGHPTPAASDSSSSAGTSRRALLQDRLLCQLLSCLVELDSSVADAVEAVLPWRYRLAVRIHHLWPRDSLAAVASLHVPAPNWDTYVCCPPLVLLLDNLTHCTTATYLLVQAALCWSLPVLFSDHFISPPNNAFPVSQPRKAPYPLFGQRHLHSVVQSICSRLNSFQTAGQSPQVLLARTLKLHLETLFAHIPHNNDKEVETLLASLVEDRAYGADVCRPRRCISSRLLALLARAPNVCSRRASQVEEILKLCLGYPTQQRAQPIEASTRGNPTQTFADLFDTEDLENCPSASQARGVTSMQLEEVEDDTSAVPDSTDCEPCLFTHLFFSPSETVLNSCGTALKVLVETRVPWRRQEDVFWFLSLLCAFCTASELAASSAPLQDCHGPPLLGLFCVLLDSLREAIKSQLLLKRWSFFLAFVRCLGMFGCSLAAMAHRLSPLLGPIWQQVALQVLRLTETAWAAGGNQWPQLTQGAAPPALVHAFSLTVRALIQLHSAGLLTETNAKVPLQLFLKQGNPRTVLQMHFMLHSLTKLVSCDRAGVAMAHSLVNFLHNLDFCELFVLPSDPSPISDGRFLGTNFLEQVILRLELADILLQVVVLSGQHQERAQLECPTEGSPKSLLDCIEAEGFADRDRRLLSHSNPLISAAISICSQTIRLCHIGRENSLKVLVRKILLCRLAGDNLSYFETFLRPLLLPMIMRHLSDNFAQICKAQPSFDDSCIIWGFKDFEDYQRNHKLTFEAFVLIDQPSNFPAKGEPASSWQVAVRILFNDGAAETVKYIQQFAKILSTAVSIAEVATHMATIILLHSPILHPPVVRNANGTSHTLAHLLIELFGLLFIPRSPEEDQIVLQHGSKGEKRTFQHFHRDVAAFFRNAPSFDFEFQRDVTNGLLEVANKFLDLPTASFAFSTPYLDVFTGERARICIWLGIMRFLVHFLYAAPSADPKRIARLRDAFASRLVLSFLDLLEAQMLVEDCRSLALLIISLSEILTRIAEEPSKNKEIECQWHNCSVYLLVELRCRVGDKSSGYWGLIHTKITESLDTLFLSGEGSRFAHCICRLDDLPENSDFAKYRAAIEKACTCARTSLSGEITRFVSTFSIPAILRCPRFLRFRSRALVGLSSRLSARLPTIRARLTKALERGAADSCSLPLSDWMSELHRRLVFAPFKRLDANAAKAEACIIQAWAPATNIDLSTDESSSLAALKGVLIGALREPFRVHSGGHLSSLEGALDTCTRESVVTCLSTLHAYEIETALVLNDVLCRAYCCPPLAQLFQSCFSTGIDPSPLQTAQFSQLVYIAQQNQLPCSAIGKSGHACLRRICADRALVQSLFDGLTIAVADENFNVSVLLSLFINCEEVCRQRPFVRAKAQTASKFSARSPPITTLEALSSTSLENLKHKLFRRSSFDIAYLVKWMFAHELVFDDFFVYLKPLLLDETPIRGSALPWMLALIFLHLKQLSANGRAGKLVTESLQNFTAFFNALLIAGTHSEDRILWDLVLQSLHNLHLFIQWLIRNHAGQRFSYDIDWLDAARVALKIGSPDYVRLLLELMWINKPEIFYERTDVHRVWIDLCRVQRDVPGLKAVYTAIKGVQVDLPMAPFADGDLSDLMRFSINETERNNPWLLSWYDHRVSTSGQGSSSAAEVSLAIQLHELGGDNAFCRYSQGLPDLLSPEDSEALLQARSNVAWRLGQWQLPEGINTGSQSCLDVSSSKFNLLPFAFTEKRLAGVKTSNEPLFDHLIFLLRNSVARGDWEQVSNLLEAERDTLIRYFSSTGQSLDMSSCDFNSFGAQLNLLSAWRTTAKVLSDAQSYSLSNLAAGGGLILLEAANSTAAAIASDFQDLRRTRSSLSLLEASLRLGHLLLEDKNPCPGNSQLPMLVLSQLSRLALVEAVVDTEHSCNLLYASQLLNSCPTTPLSTPDPPSPLDLRHVLLRGLVCAKMDRARGEVAFANTQLCTVLSHLSNIIQKEKNDVIKSHSEPFRLLLETFLSTSVSLCHWLADSRTKGWADLISQHLKPALELVDGWSASSDGHTALYSTADALATLADFADAQFKSLTAYLKSPEFAARRELLASADTETAYLSEVDKKSRYFRNLQRQSTLEAVELDNLFTGMHSYFSTALLSYGRCLALSDRHNLKVYRFVSLWLSSFTQSILPGFTESEEAAAVPSLRWLSEFEGHLMNLLAHLTSPISYDHEEQAARKSHALLRKLVVRLMLGHPHHTGYSLLSLVNADLDEIPTSEAPAPRTSSRPKRPKLNSPPTPLVVTEKDTRQRIAAELFSELCHSQRGPLFLQMKKLAVALIEFANVDVEKQRGSTGMSKYCL